MLHLRLRYLSKFRRYYWVGADCARSTGTVAVGAATAAVIDVQERSCRGEAVVGEVRAKTSYRWFGDGNGKRRSSVIVREAVNPGCPRSVRSLLPLVRWP